MAIDQKSFKLGGFRIGLAISGRKTIGILPDRVFPRAIVSREKLSGFEPVRCYREKSN